MPIYPNHRPAAGRRRITRVIQSGLAAVALTSAIGALGATVGAGGASAATARPAASAITGVTWHQLTPINGWQSGQPAYSTGNPAWTVRNGVVYLSGSIVQWSGNSQAFAMLPAAARPSRVLYITVDTLNDTQGYVTIYPDGEMDVSADPYSNAQGLTSLAGISYPAPALAMHTLALQNGWQSSQSQYSTGDPSYTVSGGVVYLSGSLYQPSGTSEVFGVLPPAARPAHTMYLSVYTYNGTTGLLEVNANGQMHAYEEGAQQYTSLAGVSFPVAAGTTQKLVLANGWQSAQSKYGTGDPSYTVSGGVVYLSGSLLQPSAGSDIFAALPKADRPAHELFIKAMVYTPGSVTQTGTVLVKPDGSLWAFSPTAQDAQQYTSLAGISYPLGS